MSVNSGTVYPRRKFKKKNQCILLLMYFTTNRLRAIAVTSGRQTLLTHLRKYCGSQKSLRMFSAYPSKTSEIRC